MDKLTRHHEVAFRGDMKGRLFGLVAVGGEARQEVGDEGIPAAMLCMLDLADILERVIDALDDGALAQQQLVRVGEESLPHVLAHRGDKPNARLNQQLLGQGLGNVATITKEFAKEAADQAGNGTAVIDIARCQTESWQFASIIDNQVQLEAVEPAPPEALPRRASARKIWCRAIRAFVQTLRLVESTKLMLVH